MLPNFQGEMREFRDASEKCKTNLKILYEALNAKGYEDVADNLHTETSKFISEITKDNDSIYKSQRICRPAEKAQKIAENTIKLKSVATLLELRQESVKALPQYDPTLLVTPEHQAILDELIEDTLYTQCAKLEIGGYQEGSGSFFTDALAAKASGKKPRSL